MLRKEEAEKLLRKAGKYGITILQREIVDDTCFDIASQKIYPKISWLLIDCLKSDGTGCGLPVEDKPDTCTAYPFKLDLRIDELIDTKNCSQAKAIASNMETVDKFLKWRERMWYKDNDRYTQMIHFMLTTTQIDLGK
jgi:hypothetical protein